MVFLVSWAIEPILRNLRERFISKSKLAIPEKVYFVAVSLDVERL